MSKEKPDKKKENKVTRQVAIKVPVDMATGVYADGSRIHIRDKAVIIDFIYELPDNPEVKTLEVVSRVNMSFHSAERFLSVFQNAVLDHINRNKKD